LTAIPNLFVGVEVKMFFKRFFVVVKLFLIYNLFVIVVVVVVAKLFSISNLFVIVVVVVVVVEIFSSFLTIVKVEVKMFFKSFLLL
jgi:hypothetical protein